MAIFDGEAYAEYLKLQEGKNSDEVFFPLLSPEEFAAACNKYMDDLEQNYDGIRVFIDQYGDAHTEFIRRETK